jgi:TolB-like protein/Tfp pilus assembly protein PilF
MPGAQGLGRYFDELKRRNVIRVAVAYLIAAWLVLQIADLVLENISAPDWVMQVFMLVFTLGFPLVLIFSWAYELTPEGLKREHEVERDRSITRNTGRRLNQITIGMLITVVLFVGFERTFSPDAMDSAPVTKAEVADKSLAVLAFEDLSAKGDHAYFAEGLSEELLNVLSQVTDLKVAGRTSSFAFKGQNKDLREIGEILKVAHILEGSVRTSGTRIRVTAQLINAADGFHLFSETYDRDLTDIFVVQDDIAEKISIALQSKLIGNVSLNEATPTEIEAFDIYLLARQNIHTRDKDKMTEAMALLDRAIAIDPEYAPALAQKALVTYLLSDSGGAYGDMPAEEAISLARPLLDKALQIDSQLAEAHAISGLIISAEGTSPELAAARLRHSLELNPNLDDARNWLAAELQELGLDTEARTLLEEVVERDPMYGPAFNNLIMDYARTGEIDKGDALVGRVSRIVGDTPDVSQSWGTLAYVQGELADAVRHLTITYDDNPTATIVKNWLGFTLLDIGDFETALIAGMPMHQLMANAALGNNKEADNLVESVVLGSGDRFLEWTLVAAYLAGSGRYTELIELVERRFGNADGLLQAMPNTGYWGTGYLGPLAYALLQQGNEISFSRLTEEMGKQLSEQQAAGLDNRFHWYDQAEYAALTGDVDDVLKQMQRAVASGFVSTVAFTSPVFDSVREDPRFQVIEQQVLTRVDEERAKLGMEPYRPFVTTN